MKFCVAVGTVGDRQLSTAGWLAIVPVFEPHWQICMANGLSTGLLSIISETLHPSKSSK
jgi:hypothetical protein